MELKFQLPSTSPARRLSREEKIQKTQYLKNNKSFWGEIKNIFHVIESSSHSPWSSKTNMPWSSGHNSPWKYQKAYEVFFVFKGYRKRPTEWNRLRTSLGNCLNALLISQNSDATINPLSTNLTKWSKSILENSQNQSHGGVLWKNCSEKLKFSGQHM